LNTLITSPTNSATLNECRFIGFLLPALTGRHASSRKDGSQKMVRASSVNFATPNRREGVSRRKL
jgi:hypothetical protein